MNARPFLAVMDPPWTADNGGGGRGAQNHYKLTSVAGIADAVTSSPLWVSDGPALVWMWATSRALVTGDAFALAALLGVRPCAGFVWAKVDDHVVIEQDHDGTTRVGTMPPRKPGLGQWQRTEHEHLLVCRRGSLQVPAPPGRSRSVIYAPRGIHSAKPEEAWRVIESTSHSAIGRACGVEFFARSVRPGWAAMGTLNGDDVVVTLE
jgi:N6-adenosine-specific RNA methylase IME4